MKIKNTFKDFINSIDCPYSGSIKNYEIEKLEKELNTILPTDYKILLQEFGSLNCNSLLKLLAEEFPYIITDFIPINRVIQDSKEYTNAGMSKDYYLFAYSPTGDGFSFSYNKNDECVYYFDHDFCRVKKIADNLNDLFVQYIKMIKKDV